MKKYFYFFLLVFIYLTGNYSVFAQEVLWKEQAPWAGVPEYYQKWDYPDYKFPSELNTWKKERVQVAETLQKLLEHCIEVEEYEKCAEIHKLQNEPPKKKRGRPKKTINK